VSSATRAPISGAAVRVTGETLITMTCNGGCLIPGYAGGYVLDVQAPGYQPVERTVNVPGNQPACGCASTETQSVVVSVTPAT
jgi:hypothetical protein